MAIPSGPEFLEAVMDCLGVDGPTGLTRAMGWDINTPSLIGKWRKGTSAPSYEFVMQMLERCGWLSIDGDVRADGARPRDRLAVIEESVIALISGQDALLKKQGLVRPGAQGDAPLPTRAAPKKKAS